MVIREMSCSEWRKSTGFAVEVIFFAAKTCFKRYKAAKKPGVTAPDQS